MIMIAHWLTIYRHRYKTGVLKPSNETMLQKTFSGQQNITSHRESYEASIQMAICWTVSNIVSFQEAIYREWMLHRNLIGHYSDVIMGAIASQITSLTIVYSTVCPGADQRKYQSSASLAFVRGIHRRPVNSPHKGPVTRKMFSLDDVIM